MNKRHAITALSWLLIGGIPSVWFVYLASKAGWSDPVLILYIVSDVLSSFCIFVSCAAFACNITQRDRN